MQLGSTTHSFCFTSPLFRISSFHSGAEEEGSKGQKAFGQKVEEGPKEDCKEESVGICEHSMLTIRSFANQSRVSHSSICRLLIVDSILQLLIRRVLRDLRQGNRLRRLQRLSRPRRRRLQSLRRKPKLRKRLRLLNRPSHLRRRKLQSQPNHQRSVV